MTGPGAPPAVVVTGAAGFIGNGVAEALLDDGFAVLALDIDFDHAESAQAVQDHPRYTRRSLDVCDEGQWRAFASDLDRDDVRLAGLVSVAAINRVAPVTDYDAGDWDAMMAVNVRGVFLAVKFLVPLLRRAKGGAIVNMSSISAFIGAKGGAAYHTTKGAVLSLSRALALELAEDDIRVNSICPGWVDTPFTDAYLATLPDPAAARAGVEAAHPLGRMARVQDVAGAVSFLMSDKARFMTGTELIVDGGFLIRQS